LDSREGGESAADYGALRAARRAFPAVTLLALLAGCQPHSRYHPLPADSTATMSADSVAAAIATAQQGWDSGAGDDAARLTAAVLLSDLRVRPLPTWSDRARNLLDSLGIGAEVGATDAALLVNLFARADPDKGSWPYLFWTTERGARMQLLEGRDLRFSQLASMPAGVPTPGSVASLFLRRAGSGRQPILMAWRATSSGNFSLMQTLGPDSLGGYGTGEFTMADTVLELHTRTYRPAKLFEECSTCPHVYAMHRFAWTPTGFTRVEDEQIGSPYSTFVLFVQAVVVNDHDAGQALIADESLWDQARRLHWDSPHGLWRAAPSSDETAHEMVFFRGETEAYRVTFEGRAGRWTITGFTPTSRSLE